MVAPSRPYLAVIGPPVLRFAEVLPPPDLSVLPPAGAPPQPVATPEPVVSPVTPHETVASTPPVSVALPAATPDKTTTTSAPPAAPLPPPILPDDTRAKVKPEDFLPFFQFPANAAHPGDVTVAVPATLTPPAPGNQPPSSATYRQQ